MVLRPAFFGHPRQGRMSGQGCQQSLKTGYIVGSNTRGHQSSSWRVAGGGTGPQSLAPAFQIATDDQNPMPFSEQLNIPQNQEGQRVLQTIKRLFS